MTVNLLKRNIHRQGIEIEVMKFCCESEVRATRVIKITVETLFESAKGQRRKINEIEVKGHFCPSYNVTDDVKIFAEVEYSTKMMIGVSADSRRFVKHVDSQPMVLIKQDTLNRSKIDVPQRKYSTKMIIGVSADNRRFVEHVDSQPMVLIKQDTLNRSKIDVPQRKYSTKMIIGVSADNRRFVEHVDSQPMVLIKQDRSKIDVPERKYPWPTRDQLVIPVLPGEEDENDEEEYDEFEEEIVVMNVRRELIWRTWLERPKQETKTVGTLVEDLLEIPSLQGKTQDWSSEKFLIEQKIESVERQPVNHAWLTDLSSFENMVA